LTLGRHPENDVQLDDELMVSRHHAVIAVEQGRYVLYDRDSANGTWVNGQRIFRHVLAPGDRIQIWQSQFAFTTSDTPPPSPAPAIADRPTIHVEGEKFCGYYLESLIGRGGMSEVFRARDANGRVVAIKILQQSDPYLVAKFVQEGNEIGPLLRGHTNIVYVYEFGKSPDNRLYIVMEYVDAPSLRRAGRGPRSEAETVKILGQVCNALSFAHENNIIHRDIKPENILVTADGVAKVLDFGIAKLTSASTVTRDKIVGTPEYISPEQARGEPVRPASDVYSVGVVLYEMLVGSVPFPRPSSQDAYKAAIEVVRQHLNDEPEPLRKRNPNAQISRHMERVTMRALKKKLRDRYSDAGELGRALGYPEADTQPEMQARREPASLAVLQGPRQGERIPLPGQCLNLGRFELGSTNTTISRQHANLFFRGDSYWLEDTSKNGTWVDNVRIYGEVPLKPGSIVVIGENVLRLESGPA
jgi:serine/threonine protein kinase